MRSRATAPNHESHHLHERACRKDAMWLCAAKAYVGAHAIAAGSMTVLALCDYRVGYDWLPEWIGVVIRWVAMLSFVPFVISSPIAALIMTFALWDRDREWLYLGICDWSLLLLQVVATAVLVCR
jgi:hypothetical protein